MKRSNNNIFKLITFSLSLMVLASFGQLAHAQDENIKESQSVSISTTENGKVKLKVVKKVGNDETTFEKTYDSHEEMENDPDLEKYGINLNSFQFSGPNNTPRIFFRNGPGGGSWDVDSFSFDIDSLRSRIDGMMNGSFGPNMFKFHFGDDSFMDMDSLVQRFNFRNDDGNIFFNGEEIEDMEELREMLKDKFDNFNFDFDFGEDWDDQGNFGVWKFGSDDGDSDVKVIARFNVFIRSAEDEDKEIAGTDEMESLELRDINFYPNPSDGRFDVDLETGSSAPIQIAILDGNGNEVYNRTGTPTDGKYNLKVDLSDREKGIYIMKVIQNNRALTKRIILE